MNVHIDLQKKADYGQGIDSCRGKASTKVGD